MKNRKSLIRTIVILFAIVLFIICYLFSSNFVATHLSDTQFDNYKNIARYLYEHNDETILEIPEDGVFIKRTVTSLTISPSPDSLTFGEVEAKLENGELVFRKIPETGAWIVANIVFGILFEILLIASIYYIYLIIQCIKI